MKLQVFANKFRHIFCFLYPKSMSVKGYVGLG